MSFDENPSKKSPLDEPSIAQPTTSFQKDFIEKVSSAVKIERLTGKILVVAVSGGPDSTSLLISLFSLRKELGLKLHVAHIDHSIREGSKEDQLFVARLAEELGLPFSTKKVNIRENALVHGTSIEEEARNARYRYFADVVKETNAHAVALGHTKDDQAETILLHLIRGSGLKGLGGMTISSSYSDSRGNKVNVFRPLLPFERGETNEFCKHSGVFPRIDETNSDQSNPRNYIRLHLLPQISHLNPKVKTAILRVSEIARRDLSYIDINLEKIWDELVDYGSESLTIKRIPLIGHHQAIQFHLLQRAFSEIQSKRNCLSSSQLKRFVESVNASRPKTFELSGGVHVKQEDKFVTLTSNPFIFVNPDIPGSHILNKAGETLVPYSNFHPRSEGEIQGWKFESDVLTRVESIDPNPFVAYLDYETLPRDITIRSRRTGDLFSPLGLASEIKDRSAPRKPNGEIYKNNHSGKKLQNFLVNAKVSADIRDSIPLLITENKVVWVVGWRIAHWARITDKTSQILYIKASPIAGVTTKRD